MDEGTARKYRRPGNRLHADPRARIQHCRFQLRLMLRFGDPEGANAERVGLTELIGVFSF